MYIKASVAHNCRSAYNNLYSGILHVCQVGASSSSRAVFHSAFGPFLFHDLRSDPRCHPLSHQPFWFPFASAIPIPPFASVVLTSVPIPVPVLVPAPRGNVSHCFSLYSYGTLLYKESSTWLQTVTLLHGCKHSWPQRLPEYIATFFR